MLLNEMTKSGHQSSFGMSTLSVVVPVYNEQEVLPEFHRRLSAVVESLDMSTQVIYVNDGSTDSTLEVINVLRTHYNWVTLVDLSRNFGKEIALTAGLDHAHGEAVIVIDADLQDPPELIPELIHQWRAGYDVVYAKRTTRHGEGMIKKATAFMFYRLIQKVSHVKIPEDTGDYRLLSRRAVEALSQLREQHRFMKGLFAWIGYPQKAVSYQRAPRFAGATKWNYWKLWNLALEGITSFTIGPLKIATYLGLISALGALLYGTYMILRTLIYGNPVPGYPSLLIFILLIGGIQLFSIGILGEYLGRIFDESKKRPLYFLNTCRMAPGSSRPKLAACDRSVLLDQIDKTETISPSLEIFR
ncbi:Glycosyltransferase involved in cell wall bisynthesis [Polaromonas sp. OV174]|uniref:glycosyltransferase family 2 protein n=1 Tax=Polaromonas sp. OV174 TaxID=1855300 RepID=UPI0008EBF727|nr:glycosyltransferase family 2 protein [Polaromonas sp. OV174]SFC26766.1 Glycosyltransferase involved in cell wall bisynthesis [Polaromonas sp. OV174]